MSIVNLKILLEHLPGLDSFKISLSSSQKSNLSLYQTTKLNHNRLNGLGMHKGQTDINLYI